jgi:hypothetical protein
MTTKAPAQVLKSPVDSLENLAYAIALQIPVEEPNNGIRLGCCLWGWLSERNGSLLKAIAAAGVRSRLTNEEIFSIISKKLEEKSINAA